MAVICGTPTPATTRVVQIEPGPMPTFTASTPASISAWVASAVATLPAISSHDALEVLPQVRIESITPREWPWAVSTTSTSTPGLDQRVHARVAIGAHAHRGGHQQALLGVLGGVGVHLAALSTSLTVISPRSSPASLTTSSFSMRLLCSSSIARFLGDALARGDQLLRHHLVHRLVQVLLEAHVAAGDDADQLAALHHGDAVDAVLAHHLDHARQRRVRARW